MKTKNRVLPQVRTDDELADAVYKKAVELDKPIAFVIEKSLRLVLGVKEKILKLAENDNQENTDTN